MWYQDLLGRSTPNGLFHAEIYFICKYLFCFSLVWFYDTSTIVGYLMPNPFDTCLLNMNSKHIFLTTF